VGCRSSKSVLAQCVGVALSTTLPWFGLDENLAIGFLRLQDEMSALSQYLQPAQVDSFSPGTQGWGLLILALACAVAMVSGISLAVLLIERRVPLGLYVLLALLALLLVVASVLDAHAKPHSAMGHPFASVGEP
jgi:hypothetical protein